MSNEDFARYQDRLSQGSKLEKIKNLAYHYYLWNFNIYLSRSFYGLNVHTGK